MKNFFKISVPALLIGLIIGYIGRGYFNKPEITVIPEKLEWKSGVINENVEELPLRALQSRLNCFNKGKPYLDIKQLPEAPYLINVEAGLCGRTWSRKARIKVAESGNFKLYLGLGLGIVGTAGSIYCGYKIYQYIKN